MIDSSKKNECIDENTLRRHLKNSHSFTFEIFKTIDSTNTYGKQSAENNAPEGLVIIAEEQTAGRGRMDRRFHSPSGTGLYMSIVLRPKIPASEALFITTAAAVSVSEAIEKTTGTECGIKWVNDVYIKDRKVCGILTEASAGNSSELKYAILGIGINLTPPPKGFPEEIKNIAGALFEKEVPEDFPSLLAANILNRFFEIYYRLPEKAFMKEYEKRSVLTGKEVDILQCGEVCGRGTVQGIDSDGGLILKKENGTVEKLSSGEVSVRQRTFNEKS